MAAAVVGQAESLITWNAKDFDCRFIRKHACITFHRPQQRGEPGQESPAQHPLDAMEDDETFARHTARRFR